MLFDGLLALEWMPCFDRDVPAVSAIRAGIYWLLQGKTRTSDKWRRTYFSRQLLINLDNFLDLDLCFSVINLWLIFFLCTFPCTHTYHYLLDGDYQA